MGKAGGKGKHRAARRSTPLLVALVVVIATAAASSGYWSVAGGIGSGDGATAADARSLTTSTGTPATQLLPGASADVALTVANPNPAEVQLRSLALDTSEGAGGFVVDAAHAACGLDALSFTTQTNGGAGWTVPASGSLDLSLTGSLTMDTAAANACQGATFTVYLEAGP